MGEDQGLVLPILRPQPRSSIVLAMGGVEYVYFG